MNFDNKTVLITGASSGIGYETAHQLAQKNARLIVLSRKKVLLDKLIEELPNNNKHLSFACDVSKYEDVIAVCNSIKEKGISIDVLFLNAGIVIDCDINPLSITSIRNEMETNFFGVIYFIEQFLPDMITKNEGLIAATSSLAAYSGLPKAEASTASKAALLRFMESLQIDLIDTKIQVTVLTPGFIESSITDNFDFRIPFLVPVKNAVKKIIRQLEKNKLQIAFPLPMVLLSKFIPLLPPKLRLWILSKGK